MFLASLCQIVNTFILYGSAKGGWTEKKYKLFFVIFILYTFNYLFVDISPHEHQAHVDFYTNWHF